MKEQDEQFLREAIALSLAGMERGDGGPFGCVIVKDGQVVEQAPVERLLRQPREDYTRKLLKAVPSLIPRQVRPGKQGEEVLQVRELRKVYGSGGFFRRGKGTLAAEDVSFTVPRGRTLGIVGESGSGKSVTSASILRLVPEPGFHAGGRIQFAGQELSTASESEMRRLRHQRVIVQRGIEAPVQRLGSQIRPGGRHIGIQGPTDEFTRRQELDVGRHAMALRQCRLQPAPHRRLRNQHDVRFQRRLPGHRARQFLGQKPGQHIQGVGVVEAEIVGLFHIRNIVPERCRTGCDTAATTRLALASNPWKGRAPDWS